MVEKKGTGHLASSKHCRAIRLSAGLWLVLAGKRIALLLHTLLSSFASGLGLGTLGVHLGSELVLTGLLGLGLVDLFSQSIMSSCLIEMTVVMSS